MEGISLELLQSDVRKVTLGPYCQSLPGPLRLSLEVDGEVIVGCELETGFLHKGLEKAFELQQWGSVLPFADRLEPESAVFGELALCLAVEEIAGVEVPARGQYIRILLCELTRISSHLGYLLRIARLCSSDVLLHCMLREREKLLDLFELLSGARFSLNFLRFGGVSADMSDGFLERVLEICDLIRMRIKEYNDLLSFNHAFLKRLAYTGIIDREEVIELGITGPNARASGVDLDVRKAHPYGSYSLIEFEIPVGTGEFGVLGDCHERFLVRIREITQSLDIIKQVAERLPGGPYVKHLYAEPDLFLKKLPKGESYSRIESPRGLLGCHLVSDGSDRPSRVQFRTPSSTHLEVLPNLLQGARLEDVYLVMGSLDISIAEVDR